MGDLAQPERVRPPALRPGDTVGIIAPAGVIHPDALEAGCAWLERKKLRPFHLPSILDRNLYFAGSRKRRLDEFHEMFTRPEVKAIICARGGYGCNYLLPEIDLDLVRANRKIFCGSSDVTTLLTFLCDRAGMVTLHGPMLNTDVRPDGVDDASWNAGFFSGEAYRREFRQLEVQTLVPGSAQGMLYGGCLSLLCASIGTPYEIETNGTILFIEDLAEPAFRIDRMLMQLKYAGKFEGVRGIVFGEMLKCGPRDSGEYTLTQVIERVVGNLGIPIAYGLKSGHVSGGNITIPFGVQAQFSAAPDTVSLAWDASVQREPSPATNRTS
jgi:muramoyltetrapeptide carboxypeptidase